MGETGLMKGLSRSINQQEYKDALKAAKSAGIHRLDQRRRVFAFY
jgi:hypothetical protein